MKASRGWVVTLVVCALAGIGALGCNGVNGAGRGMVKEGKGIRNPLEDAQDLPEHAGPHTITASAESGGVISPTGSTNVPRGLSQTFIATANEGYRVADILVDGQSVGARSDLYHDDSSSFTFDDVVKNHSISASFTVNLNDESTIGSAGGPRG